MNDAHEHPLVLIEQALSGITLTDEQERKLLDARAYIDNLVEQVDEIARGLHTNNAEVAQAALSEYQGEEWKP